MELSRTRKVLFLVPLSILVVAFQNCSPGFSAVPTEDEVLPSTQPPVSEPAASSVPVAKTFMVAAPTQIKTGECAAFMISWVDLTRPQAGTIVFPDSLRGMVFADSACRPTTEIATLAAESLPVQLYFRSDYLFYGTITPRLESSVGAPMARADDAFVNVYRARFMNTDTGARTAISNDSSLGGRFFDVFNPTPATVVTANLITPSEIGTPAGRLLGSNFAFAQGMAFSRTKVYFAGRLSIDTNANAITNSAQITEFFMACFSARNDVYCTRSTSGPYEKVALPSGRLSDLSSALGAPTCAVVDGKVYCWRPNLVVEEIPSAGPGNLGVVVTAASSLGTNAGESLVNGTFCVLKVTHEVLCATRGGNLVTIATDAKKISSGLPGTGLMIGHLFTERTTHYLYPTGTSYVIESSFDEVYPHLSRTAGCGRKGQSLFCWDSRVSGPIIRPQPVVDVTFNIL
ncbi:MAG: hypothetical protein AAB250_15705 [Bdellovibrionota bacterium]